MASETIDKPRTAGPGSGLGRPCRIIVLNDNHNTFTGVAATLSRTLPGVTLDRGFAFADQIHSSGQAVVWSGQVEPGELYWEQLDHAGLTMAPLDRG